MSETLLLRRLLRDEIGLELDAVIVNGLLPEQLDAGEARAVDAALARADVTGLRRTALQATHARHARGGVQRAQLRRLRRALDGDVAVQTLPALVAGGSSADGVATLARRLQVAG